MDGFGAPIAWRGITEGMPVFDRERRCLGIVERVEAAADIFEAIVIHTRPLPGRHLFARHDQIGELRERGVVLAVAPEALSDPEVPRRPPDDRIEPRWQAWLRRARDWLTNRR
jgi:hypothetical protein